MRKPVSVIKKVFAWLAGLMLITFIMAACQPTPETPPVVNKGDDHLEEIIAASTQTPIPTPTIDPEKTKEEQDEALRSALRETLGAPETYADSLENKNGRVTVTFDDAAVIVPAVQSIPAVALKHSTFSQETVDKFAAYFLKGVPVFTQEEVRTKEEIEAEIIRLKKDIQTTKNEDDLNKTVKEYLQGAEQHLKELEAQYLNAPIERAKTPATLDFIKTQYGMEIDVVADLKKDDVAGFSVYNGNQESSFHFSNSGKGFYHFRSIPISDELPKGMTMSIEEATSLVNRCLSDLGLTDMMIDAAFYKTYSDFGLAKSDKQCYHFEIKRLFHGIPVTRIDAATPLDGDDPSIQRPKDPEYTDVVRPEWLFIQVDDTGIVDMQWTAPFEDDEVISENVTLLPFDEIVQAAKDNMFYQGYSDSICTARIHITRIELGMMRIMRKDMPGKYMMVPVWDFIGDREDTVYGKTQWLGFGDQSYVTINAIDGSPINREWGY